MLEMSYSLQTSKMDCRDYKMSSTVSLTSDMNSIDGSGLSSSKKLSTRGAVNYSFFLKYYVQKLFDIPPYLVALIAYINYKNPDFLFAEIIFIIGQIVCEYPISLHESILNESDGSTCFYGSRTSCYSSYSSNQSLNKKIHSYERRPSSVHQIDSFCAPGDDVASSKLLEEIPSSELQSSFSSELLTPASFIPVVEGDEVDEWGHFTDFDEAPSVSTGTETDPFNSLEKSVLRRRGDRISVCKLEKLTEEDCDLSEDS